jgi:hypothetical protein
LTKSGVGAKNPVNECNRDFSSTMLRVDRLYSQMRLEAVKPLAKKTTTFVISLALISFLFTRRLEACWQTHTPSIRIRSRSLAGTVNLDGNAISEAVLTLHRFLGPYSVQADHAESHPLRRAITARDGKFSFGEVPSGKYVVMMHSPSSEATGMIEVIRPLAGENDTVAIEYFADFCQNVVAISVKGDKLSSPATTIFGMSK